MKDYQFIKFEGLHGRQENRITITKSNQIGFPTKFYEDNHIKDFKYVVLFLDKKNKAVGVHFANDEKEKNKFSILHSKAGYGGSVSVRSFFRLNGIDPQVYHGKYNWEKQDITGVGKIFVFELKESEENKT